MLSKRRSRGDYFSFKVLNASAKVADFGQGDGGADDQPDDQGNGDQQEEEDFHNA